MTLPRRVTDAIIAPPMLSPPTEPPHPDRADIERARRR
jgi:hypothetical protein